MIEADRSVRMPACWLTLLLASVLSAGVRPEHPRLFINTDPAYYNCVDSLRARVLVPPFRAEYERLTMWRNSYRDVPRGLKPANVLPSYAIRWVIDPRDTAAADTALAMMLAVGRDDGQFWNLSMIAVAYDWLYHYPAFGEPEKALVRERIARFTGQVIERIRTDDDIFNNHSWYHLRAVFLAALALMGEDERADRWLEFARAYWENNLEPALELLDGGWHEGISYSTRATLLNLGMWLAALESSSLPRRDPFAAMQAGRDWLTRYTRFYAAHLLPDGSLINYNDVPWFVVGGTWDNARLFMITARKYRDPLAAWILQRIAGRGLELEPLHIWYYLLWYDPTVKPEGPEAVLDKSLRLCPEAYDLFFLRSSWTDPQATVVTFHAGDWFGAHDHLDVGHFSIFREKPLAVDAGVYAGMDTPHYVNYYGRSLAHNTLLVHDPEEHFQVPAPGEVKVYNDGGQRVVVSLDGRSTQFNFTTDVWQANRLEGFHFERATVLDWHAGQALDYVRADITRAYNSDFFCGHGRGRTNRPKVDRVERALVYLKPSTVVVHDRVKAKDPSFSKTWQLNTAGQPYLGGENTFMAVNGPAKLAGRTFLPEHPRREIWGSNSRPLILDGWDMHHHQDFTGFPATPGGWIVRVSPAEPRLEDEFLHLLVAGSAGQTAADLLAGWRLVQAEGASVLAGDEAVLIFPDKAAQRISFLGPGRGEALTAYLLGAEQDALYRVRVEGEKEARLLRPDRGVLSFGLRGAGQVEVAAERK
ncbi:MAG: DUF4962 domain-containing protein [Candidatus Glassbacteria bacterium]|nr:DUF4962 domain-containing protein [Candidatus Glassbacteria bacterium]